jgi:hypothetical protein
MEQATLKYQNLLGAYNTYIRSVELYEFQQKTALNITNSLFSSEELIESARRSLIQAFEILVEVLWKYLKWLMEEIYQVTIEVTAPRPIITKACEIRIITEQQSQQLIDLITLRNQTSHIYKEELIIIIAQKLCAAHTLLSKIITQCKI